MIIRLGVKTQKKDVYRLQDTFEEHGLNTVDYQIISISHRPLYTHIMVDLKGKIIHRHIIVDLKGKIIHRQVSVHIS